VQNIIPTLKKLFYLWRRSQVPVKQPIKISKIDNLIIFLVCILISIISSYKLLLTSPLNIADFFSWLLTFTEILISSGILILVLIFKEERGLDLLKQFGVKTKVSIN